ncbi:Seminal metalloprotease 1 [Frankliniella fusca]|uniref:Metalloendopeptidase n=1 Tax=Frankliniella fusca TaxID=407009 RepID=A0AAE1H1U8_9NEOP|nr:Seminal metalloprotease 1 [Frankliniella fusca]
MILAVWAFATILVACKAKPAPEFDFLTDFLTDWIDDSDIFGTSEKSYELGNPWEKSGEFEGDIILGPDDSIRNGLVNEVFYWPNKTLVYKIDTDSLDESQRSTIERAIAEFHKKTCIRMREKNHHDLDYVFITGKGAHGCSSHVGRQGGKQALFLKPNQPGKGCFKKGTIIHELLHALGFYHQQSAPERDQYVKILWDNIQPGREHNFRKYDRDSVSDFNVSYDYQSIMHYSAYAFSQNEKKTIVPLENGATIGQRKTLSEKDIAKLHNMYKCKTTYTEEPDFGSTHGPDTDTDDIGDFETILEE